MLRQAIITSKTDILHRRVLAIVRDDDVCRHLMVQASRDEKEADIVCAQFPPPAREYPQ